MRIMSNKGKSLKGFLGIVAILLINMQVVNSQGLFEFSDFLLEFTGTDGYVREKRDVTAEVQEYVIIIEVNVSQAIVLDRIKSSLASRGPHRVDNTTEINSLNITTVCQLNSSEYQCRCEDQYFWSAETCNIYKSCNKSKGLCTCIDAFPSDGQICVPKSELAVVDYLVEIEIAIEKETMLNKVRKVIGSLDFPLSSELKDLDITTECTLNGTEYQCRCEDQYFWPCEKCSAYGSCNSANSSLCGCINAVPKDGLFCQPISKLNMSTCSMDTSPAEYLIEVEIDAVNLTVLKYLRNRLETLSLPISTSNTNISDIKFTTECILNGTEYQCMCLDQYSWPCEKCKLYGFCKNFTNSSCGCANAIPYDGHFCQPISELPNNSTCPAVPTDFQVLCFSLTIMEMFNLDLTNKRSTKYKTYKGQIENSINESYSTVSGYKLNSATVTDFRSGSVIADFTIQATSANLDLVSANQNLARRLRLLGFNVSDEAFISQSVKDGLYQNNGPIYPGTDLNLICNSSVTTNITWTHNNVKVTESSNILSLKNASPGDSGQYACITTVNSLPYTIWQIITIQPYPELQVTTNKVVQCVNTTIPLSCCVQLMYQIEWNTTLPACRSTLQDPVTGCISCDYTVDKQQCQTDDQILHLTCQLKNPINGSASLSYNLRSITLHITNKKFDCFDSLFGAGNVGDQVTGNCSKNMTGSQIALCNSSKIWHVEEDKCVLKIFDYLNNEAKKIMVTDLPAFMASVSNNATSETLNIINSPGTILTIVQMLSIISNLSQATIINKPLMMDFLKTNEVIGSDGAQNTWVLINSEMKSRNASSKLLNVTESIARRLPDENILIATNLSTLNKTLISSNFSGEFGKHLTTQVFIPVASAKTFLTVIISPAFNNILPVRNLSHNDSNQTGTQINGDVAMIETTSTINNIALSFTIQNKTLGNPHCVFWNFSLLSGIGGWDSSGCRLKAMGNKPESFTCECDHTTSFSILMSPFSPENCPLDIITYIGVGISMGSLVLCLFIEGIIWKSVRRYNTSHMRHVAIVNIALSLLIANICFIIGAAVVKKDESHCNTATFFMHFFYLAVFFWMLLSALLLLYRIVQVFSRMTRGAMMGIGFTVGYGAPLLIAVITVASTAGGKGYIQQGYNCWLNWKETKALLAFVLPALTIVAINLVVVVVFLCKILRRPATANILPEEKHPLLVIARSVAILTPLFGLTWGFGIGTMVSPECGVHIVFAFLNSLQGFFILVFGTLLDRKVREILANKFSLKNLSSGATGSTIGGPTSSSVFPFFQRIRQKKWVQYHEC